MPKLQSEITLVVVLVGCVFFDPLLGETSQSFSSAGIQEKVTCPVLAISGDLDLQVPPRQNLPVIESALKAGGYPDYTVKELAGLNHLLQEAKTGSPQEHGKIEQTMSPAALRLIADWIAARS